MNVLLEMAVRAAIRAGRAIMEIYNHPQAEWEVEYKSDNSPLTLADRKAHEIIAQELAATPFPVLSEEGAHADYSQRRVWSTFWVVDPLDGTKEFVKRNGEFTVNIALVGQGAPILGVVYVPVSGVLYYGSPDDGAAKARVKEGSEELTDKQALPLEGASVGRPYTVVASRSHLSVETQTFIDELKAMHGEIEMVSRGSSLKICMVAEGVADVYPRMAPTMEWDTAAGHAVVLAAGGCMVNAESGTSLIYNKEDLHNPWFVVWQREEDAQNMCKQK